MTVYKGYMRIAKKNTGIILLYLGIFFCITLMFQSMNGQTGASGYQAKSLKVAVIDEDGGVFAGAFVNYLKQFHQVTEMENDVSVLQEKLFYRDLDYIVRIPSGFYESCVKNRETMDVTKVPGSYTAYYADQQISSFINSARVYQAAGFTEEETAKAVEAFAEAKVELLEEGAGETPAYVFYFRYMPYLFTSVLGYTVGNMVSSMRRGDLKKRMRASAIPERRQSAEGLLACATVALILWGITMAVSVLMYGKELRSASAFFCQLFNSLALLSVSVSISYLIGNLVSSSSALNGLVNVASLGLCFLGGAFVPLDVMSGGVKKAAQFLPVYWFETANDLLGGFDFDLIKEQALSAIGIQFVFAAVFVSLSLALAKVRQTA